MVDVLQTIETAKVYGQQAAASLAAIRAIDITDPAGMVETINDQVRALADALGFDGELSEVTGVAGVMGRVIQLATGEIEKFMDRKGVESDTERDEQQENIMKGLDAKYGLRSAWVTELESNALPGDDGYYTDVGGSGVPGIVTGSFGPALPLDRTSGCYRQGFAGRGKSAGAGAWRFWPALYPLCMNTTNLSFVNMTAFKGRYALKILVRRAQAAFSAAGNLWINGEEVAHTLSTFLAWARPGFAPDLFSKTPIYKAGGSMGPIQQDRTDSEGKKIVVYAYRTYVMPDGTLDVPQLPADLAPNFTRWWGAGSFEPAAYNYVLRTCARWFAVREALLRAPWTWADDPAAKAAAEASPEPSVQAALKRINDKPKVKRVGRSSTPAKGRHGTSTTTPGPRPANARPEVNRVGRPSTPTLTPERFDAIRLEMFPWLAGR